MITVSLTTIAGNNSMLSRVMKSLYCQTLLPDEIFVYYSSNSYLSDKGFADGYPTFPPPPQNINVKAKEVPNTGPYRKLLPILWEKKNIPETIIVTVDDDTVYHPELLQTMYKDYLKRKCVIASRAFTLCSGIEVENVDYHLTRERITTDTAVRNFHTGKGGVLYTPEMMGEHVFDKSYEHLCPTNDDIWFNVVRMLHNVECYVLPKRMFTDDLTKLESALYQNYNKDLNTQYLQDTMKYFKMTAIPSC